jgi:hypothetical protein
MRQREVYKRVEEAAETQGLDAAGVENLSAQVMRALAGVQDGAVTATLLAGIRRKVAAVMRRKELEAAATWIETQLRTRFPQAAAVVGRGRVIEVWLDGLPKEEE